MPLHEFITERRGEILATAVQKMKSTSPELADEELTKDFEVVIDEIARALQKQAGLPTESPLPGKSAAATRHGAVRQRRGHAIEKIALDFGTISDAVGELGDRDGLQFPAGDYRVFNACIDTSIASALEQFSEQERQQHDADTVNRIAALAHELRNALSTARMAFELLRGGQVGINSKTGNVLGRGLSRLEELITNTLVAVRLHGGVQLEPRRIAVASLLHDARDTTFPEHCVEVAVDAPEELEVDVDERLIGSALTNLLQNAIKFTRAGGHVTLRALARAGGAIVIEVEDECGGLPPGKQEELFEPYVQRGDDRRGLGLGLAITRDAVLAHGAHIDVEDLPGKGCIFRITLPAPAPT